MKRWMRRHWVVTGLVLAFLSCFGAVVLAYNLTLTETPLAPQKQLVEAQPEPQIAPVIPPRPSVGTSDHSKQANSNSVNSPTVCTTTTTPYQTYFRYDSTMYVGETYEYGGTNGSKKICKYASGQTFTYTDVDPYDKVVYRGTKAKKAETITPTVTYTYEQALSIARNTYPCPVIAQASGTGSSAYQVCIQSVLKQYGF